MDPDKRDSLTFRGFWFAYLGLFGLAASIITDIPPNILGVVVKAGFGILAGLGLVLCVATRLAKSATQNHVLLSRSESARQEDNVSEPGVCPDPSHPG